MTTRLAIDWQAIKARLRETEAALASDLSNDPARLQRVLQERAQQLAARRTMDGARSTAWPGLVFTLGAERFCLPVAALVEVLRLVSCSPLPGANPELLGVMNVRGDIRSVVDLARLLGLPSDVQQGGYVILMRQGAVELGFRVDEVEKIEMVLPEGITSLDGTTSPQGGALAIGRTPGRATILDVKALFSRIVN